MEAYVGDIGDIAFVIFYYDSMKIKTRDSCRYIMNISN